MKALFLSLLLAVGVGLSGSASGQDLDQQSRNIFNSMTNHTEPGVVMGARQGTITGGSLTIRNKLTNVQLGTVQLPRINAGCGGIDLFMGSFSFITSQQLVAAMRAIPGAAVSYGFQLALKSMCPSCEDALAKLQSEINKWTQMSMNACQISQSLFESTGMDESITKTFSANNALEGYAKGWLDSSNNDKAESPAATTAQHDPEAYKELLPGNVIWRALKESNSAAWLNDISGGDEWLENIMSMTGTVVFCSQGLEGCPANPDGVTGQTAPDVMFTYPPVLGLRAFVFGTKDSPQTLTRYSCGASADSKGCLQPVPQALVSMDGLKKMIEDTMVGVSGTQGLISAIRAGDRPPNAVESGLITGGGLYIQLAVQLAAASPDAAHSYILAFSDVIAAEVAFKILTADLDVALQSLTTQTFNRVDTGRALVQAAVAAAREDMRVIYSDAYARDAAFQYYRSIANVLPRPERPSMPTGGTNQ